MRVELMIGRIHCRAVHAWPKHNEVTTVLTRHTGNDSLQVAASQSSRPFSFVLLAVIANDFVVDTEKRHVGQFDGVFDRHDTVGRNEPDRDVLH